MLTSEIKGLTLQAVGCLAVLYGIACYCVPAALIVGGLALVAAIERQVAANA